MPLAAISLGYLCRTTTNEWKAILDSDIWAENGDDGRLLKDTKVLPSLKLSYQYMSYHLKLCFAYCAVFPKGWYIEKSSLINSGLLSDLFSSMANRSPHNKLEKDTLRIFVRCLFFRM
jgi:hypothetical protein